MDFVYLCGGPEIGRRNDFIEQLKDNFKKSHNGNIDEFRFYADDTSIPDLLDTLRGGGLFSSGKFVQFFSVDQVKLKADTELLASYIKKPASDTVLVLVSDGLGADKIIENAFTNKDAKKIFWEMNIDEAAQWIRSYFKSQSIQIEEEAVEEIMELVENNTAMLRNECSRLVLFYPKGSVIKSSDIDNYISHNRKEDAFSLFDKMAEGNFEKSIETLQKILSDRDGSSIGLVSGLSWSFRRLESLHERLNSGEPFDVAARALRITRRQAMASYKRALKMWNYKTCKALIAFGVETDVRLREFGTTYNQTILEMFIYACVVAKRSVLDLNS